MLQARVRLGFSFLPSWSAVSGGELPIKELASKFLFRCTLLERYTAVRLGGKKTVASLLQLPLVGPKTKNKKKKKKQMQSKSKSEKN